MIRRLALVLLACAALYGGGARADDVIADLSSHLVAINTGFTGTSVVLFGAVEGGGDVIAVVRGPEREMTVWRKGKVVGIWVNAESVTFRNVPSFYFVSSSRPLPDILSTAAMALHRIGTGNLKLDPKTAASPQKITAFAQALVEQQQTAGVFGLAPGKVSFLGERLFRATLSFPANVPTGTYLVEVFLVRNGEIVGGQTTPLVVSKVGVDAALSEFATRQAGAYGAIAVIVAVVAGWLASLAFRGV